MESCQVCTFWKAARKVEWCILLHWDGSALDTKAEWGTIIKHRAIKGVPDRLSKVWWAKCVTPELQGSTANQPPRRGSRGVITQALHHRAGRKAITSPFPCAVIPIPYLQLWNQGAQMTREALDGGKDDWWVQSNEEKKKKELKEKERRKLSDLQGVYSTYLKSLNNQMDWEHEGEHSEWRSIAFQPAAHKILVIGLANWNLSLVMQCIEETSGTGQERWEKGGSHFQINTMSIYWQGQILFGKKRRRPSEWNLNKSLSFTLLERTRLQINAYFFSQGKADEE